MTTTSATPPATRRIARSYLTDFIAAAPLPNTSVGNPRAMIAPIVEQLLERAVRVRHVLKSDQLVLTFDLADDPAGWSTASPAGETQGTSAGLAENRDYPGQPGEKVSVDDAL